jgi:hypothetical protein
VLHELLPSLPISACSHTSFYILFPHNYPILSCSSRSESTMEDNDENNQQILDIISKTEKISCADNRLELPPNQESLGFSLIGKLLSTRSFNGSAVQEIVSKAWNPKRTIKVTPTGKNIFIFGFELESDMQQVFYKRPWTIKGAHLILKEWCPDLAWDEVDFNWSTFWIQVHGVPRSWKSKDNLVHIGTEAGM